MMPCVINTDCTIIIFVDFILQFILFMLIVEVVKQIYHRYSAQCLCHFAVSRILIGKIQ